MFSKALRKLSNVFRYGPMPKIKQQNVAEHSFYVVNIVWDLICLLKWQPTTPGSVLMAVMYAVMHDSPEAGTGDLIFGMKRVPAVKAWVGEAEKWYTSNNLLSCHVLFSAVDSHPLCKQIKLLTKMADQIESWMYLQEEIDLGNKVVSRESSSVEQEALRVWNLMKEEGMLDQLPAGFREFWAQVRNAGNALPSSIYEYPGIA